MSAVLAFLWAQFGPYLVAAAAGLLAVGAAYLKGRSAAKADERARQAEATLEIVKDHKDAQEAVDSLSSGDARERLRRWAKD